MKQEQQLLEDLADVRPYKLVQPGTFAIFMDFGSVAVKARAKTIILCVRTAWAWITSGQATAQLFDSADAVVATQGATTQIGTANAPTALTVGTAQNIGPVGTALALNLTIRWDVSTIAALQWPFANLGVELKFPSAPSVGAMDILVV